MSFHITIVLNTKDEVSNYTEEYIAVIRKSDITTLAANILLVEAQFQLFKMQEDE